jgi:threonine/homoserine/homoserine lactone efflux protein
MGCDSLVALFILSFSAAFTPGPNNALVAASGANFGFRRTFPHILGISLGFPVMIFIVGLFLGQVFQSSLLLRELLRWIGVGLLFYVAYKIAIAGGLGSSSEESRPFRFDEAALFQWVNPKGWSMAIAITSQFATPNAPMQTAVIIAAVFVFFGLTSASTWAVLGVSLQRFLETDDRLKWFNRVIAMLIAGCVVFLFLD